MTICWQLHFCLQHERTEKTNIWAQQIEHSSSWREFPPVLVTSYDISCIFLPWTLIEHIICTFWVSDPNHSSFISKCYTNALFPTPTTELHFSQIQRQERYTQQPLSLFPLHDLKSSNANFTISFIGFLPCHYQHNVLLQFQENALPVKIKMPGTNSLPMNPNYFA
jgi:hypothetical protein